MGIQQAESVCNHSTNIVGTSKQYYDRINGCLCQRDICHVVQCSSRSSVPCPDVFCCWKAPFWAWQINEPHFLQVQFCSMRRNKYAFCAFHFCQFCAQDVFCIKSIMLNNFVIHLFPASCTFFEIETLTQNFAARLRSKWFHCVAHVHLSIPRHHFYDYSCFHLEIVGVATDFSGHTVYFLLIFWFFTFSIFK